MNIPLLQCIKACTIILVFQFLAPSPTICEAILQDTVNSGAPGNSISIFPIAMYDSDIGFGLGIKTAMNNTLSKKSYDMILFGSTKGEQWYAFTYSWPDNDSRLGVKFPLALDFKIEYDKLVKSNYFGIGNQTADNNFQFPREFFEIEQSTSHSFSSSINGGLTIRFAHYSVYDYRPEWNTILRRIPGAYENSMAAVGIVLRYDTRDSWINPKKGMKAEFTLEQSLKILGFDWKSKRSRLELSMYKKALGQNDIIAGRLWVQDIDGISPYQEMSKIGDGWTARGYKAERFLDKTMALTSVEYRFPIFKHLGGTIFGDAGRVSSSVKKMNLRNWHTDYGSGLRYYLANFVARLDIGRSVEGTRIFFNFGQVF